MYIGAGLAEKDSFFFTEGLAVRVSGGERRGGVT